MKGAVRGRIIRYCGQRRIISEKDVHTYLVWTILPPSACGSSGLTLAHSTATHMSQGRV